MNEERIKLIENSYDLSKSLDFNCKKVIQHFKEGEDVSTTQLYIYALNFALFSDNMSLFNFSKEELTLAFEIVKSCFIFGVDTQASVIAVEVLLTLRYNELKKNGLMNDTFEELSDERKIEIVKDVINYPAEMHTFYCTLTELRQHNFSAEDIFIALNIGIDCYENGIEAPLGIQIALYWLRNKFHVE